MRKKLKIFIPAILGSLIISCTPYQIFAETANSNHSTAESDTPQQGVVAIPVANVESGTYDNPFMVRFSCQTPGVAIYYTTDGTTPSESSSIYGLWLSAKMPAGGPPDLKTVFIGVSIQYTTNLKAIAVLNGKASNMVSYQYAIKLPMPDTYKKSGVYRQLPSCDLYCTAPGATIYYTTDGTIPSAKNGIKYRTPINLTSNATIKAIAVKEGSPDSPVATYSYSADPGLVLLTDPGASIEKVIAEMTLAEKCRIASGYYSFSRSPEQNMMGAAGATYPIERLGIPSALLNDGPSGISFWSGATTRYATAWPNGSLLASSWNLKLMDQLGKAYAAEGLYYGADILLAPAMNIHRDPLGGRNWEYFAEDPFLTGKLAASFSKSAQAEGLGVSLKHYAANNSENNRQGGNELIDERTLREIYLTGFETAVKESKPWTVMAAYNKVNGLYMTEQTHLLTDILKKEWGFDGYVMADWGAYHSPVAFKAGLDINTPGGDGGSFFGGGGLSPADEIKQATEKGMITEKDLERAIVTQLRVLIKTNTFKKVQEGIKNGKFTSVNAYTKSLSMLTSLPAELALEDANLSGNAAAEGIVLLKNNGALPLKSNAKIGTAGINWVTVAVDIESYQKGFVYGGKAASAVIREQDIVSPAEGLAKEGFILIQKNSAGQFITESSTPEDASYLASNADVALISIGRIGCEGSDNASFNLKTEEVEMIRKIGEAFHKQNKKVIVMLNTSSTVEVASWENYADAIMWVGLPGQHGGIAIAEIISGKINPSGKLTTTWPVKYSDVPDYGNFPSNPRDTFAYKEGVYVGYRYYDSKGVKPQFHFGHGLSYTTFEYSNIELSKQKFNLSNPDETITITADIKNIGNVVGKEVAQLYVHDNQSSIDRPLKELKGFVKTNLLKPGEKQQVSFTINRRALSYFRPDATTDAGWTAEPGVFTLIVGGTSDGQVLNKTGKGLSAEFEAISQ